MAISKRLRFEILRRDNHTCRYCGSSAPDVALHVDHVVPETLGGATVPENLVTSCADCNLGKSSVPADSAVVADVQQDAVKWARALELVAQGRAADRMEKQERRETFRAMWSEWRFKSFNGKGETVPLGDGWETTIDTLLASGLDMGDFEELIRVAMESPARDTWRYFCGCCWRRIEKSQEHARAIVTRWEVDGDG